MSTSYLNNQVETVISTNDNTEVDYYDNYIMKEFYKNFKIEEKEKEKLTNRINKINGSSCLDLIINQDSEVYNVIALNYNTSVDLVNGLN